MPDIAPAVLLTLSLDPLGDLRPYVGVGQGMRVTIVTLDRATAAPLAATGVRVIVGRPDLPAPMEYLQTQLSADGVGRWILDLPSEAAGAWRVRAECTGPRPAARELSYWVTPSPLAPDAPPAALMVTAQGEIVDTPGAGLLTVVRLDRMAALGAPEAGDVIVVVRGDAAGNLTWDALEQASTIAGAEAGAEAAVEPAQQAAVAIVQPVLAATVVARDDARAAATAAAGAVSGAAITVETYAALEATTTEPVGGGALVAGRRGIVFGDGEERGEYCWDGDGWVYEAPLLRDYQADVDTRIADDGTTDLSVRDGQGFQQIGVSGEALAVGGWTLDDDGVAGLRLRDPAGFEVEFADEASVAARLRLLDAETVDLAEATSTLRADVDDLVAADDGAGAYVVDGAGFQSVALEHGLVDAGAWSITAGDEDGLTFGDPYGFFVRLDVPQTAPAEEPEETVYPEDVRPYICGPLHGVAGVPLSIYVSGMLLNRTDAPYCHATLAGRDGVYSGGDQITFDPGALGPSAELVVRPTRWDGTTRATVTLAAMAAEMSPAVAPTPKILMIGDSIINREAASLCNEYLTAWGYAPEFIGTMVGNGPTSSSDGLLGEGREGWESGDYTYAITDWALVLPPGDEAAYLSMSKLDQRDRNPFIRAATGGDAAEDIVNGYVLDFDFYQSRFALETPDIVVYEIGTNDIRDREAAVIYDTVLAADTLIYRRLRAAWPDATIIRMLPGTARAASRDALWTSEYIPVIRAIKQAIIDADDPGIVLAPTWAMVTQDAGYAATAATVDPTTGSVVTTLADTIHPVAGARRQLWRVVAGYIACAST